MYGTDYDSVYGSTSAVAGMSAGLVLLMVCFALAITIFLIIVEWKVFTKAGKPGWAAIIPIYNQIVLFDIIGYNWYYIFVFCLSWIPVIGSLLLLFFCVTMNIKLAKAYGQSVGFGIGLLLLSPVFTAILAFNKDIKYVGKSVNGNIDFKDLF